MIMSHFLALPMDQRLVLSEQILSTLHEAPQARKIHDADEVPGLISIVHRWIAGSKKTSR